MKDEVQYEFDFVDHHFEFLTIINNQRIYQLKQIEEKLTKSNGKYLQSI